MFGSRPIFGRGKKAPEHPGIHIGDDPDIEIFFPEETSKAGSIWSEAKSLLRDIIFAGVVAILVLVFVVRPVKVEGTSMEPRLENDERIFVNEFIYNFSPIERGDIVVFWYPDDPSKSFIKRVVGLPGEKIRIDHDGTVYINDKPVEEPYLSPDKNRKPRPAQETTVRAHYYFVMGDNRDASNDSRSWGLVPEKYIYGKAMFRYWPLPKMGPLSD
jgi:signal peptidase I